MLCAAQLVAQTATPKMSLGECLDYALAHNEGLKTAHLEIEYHKQFRKAATEIPKTAITFQQGQFNSVYKFDNSINVVQQLPFPGVFVAHNALGKTYIKGSEYKLAATQADLMFQVKSTYYSLLYHYALGNLLHKEDSLCERFARSEQARYDAGKASLVEKTAAEAKVMETRNELLENDEDIHSFKVQLQTLLNSETEVDITPEDIAAKPLTISAESLETSLHPYMQYLNQQIIAGRQNRLLELYKAFPDLQLGYVNLSIYGWGDIGTGPYFLNTGTRMQVFMAGLNIPLWIRPYAAKVKAAAIKTREAQSDYNYHKTIFEGEFRQAMILYHKYRNSLDYYRKNALVSSETIIGQALEAFDKKELGYVEYLGLISDAWHIERNYLSVINQNNQTVLKLEYLLNK